MVDIFSRNLDLFVTDHLDLSDRLGELSEQVVGRAQQSCEKAKAASEEMAVALRENYSSNARGATDYGLKVIEISNANTASAIDFFALLLGSKSVTDVFTLSAAQARKAFDTTSAQNKDLWSLPRSLRPRRASRSGSTSPKFSAKATKKAALYSHPEFVQEGDPAGWNEPRHEHATPCSIKQRAGARSPPSMS